MTGKRIIPRGYCRRFISTWDEECDSHYEAIMFSTNSKETTQTTTDVIQCLNAKHKQRWEGTVQSIDFTHSSRVVWKTFNRFTGRNSQPKRCSVTANSIAHQLLLNPKFKEAYKTYILFVKQEYTRLWNAPSVEGSLSAFFPIKELSSSIKSIKPGKAKSLDNIHPEFLKHCGPKSINWMKKFFSAVLKHQFILKIWRKATVVALPTPLKPPDVPRSCCPISLLCVPYKI